MEPCYQYLGCKKTDCIMYDRKKEGRCWEIEETLCNHRGIQLVREKLKGKKKEDACSLSGCIYYRAVKEKGLVKKTAEEAILP